MNGHSKRERMKMAGYDIFKADEKFRYQLLNRMQGDCDYYLGNGNRSRNALWAENEKEQIEVMKKLWNSFADDEKPEWLSWEGILNYESKMVVKTIKEQLLDLGMEENEIDSHESDLYVLKNPISLKWLMGYEFKQNVTEFRSQIDNKIWFDIPFGYANEHHKEKYNL